MKKYVETKAKSKITVDQILTACIALFVLLFLIRMIIPILAPKTTQEVTCIAIVPQGYVFEAENSTRYIVDSAAGILEGEKAQLSIYKLWGECRLSEINGCTAKEYNIKQAYKSVGAER